MAKSVSDWLNDLGPVTQKCFFLIIGLSLSASLHLLHPRYFLLDWAAIFKQLQVWRLATNMFFFGMFGGPGTFAVLINIYLFVMYAGRLEEGIFKGKRADFVWLLITTGLIMMVAGSLLLGVPTTSGALLLVVVWVWCRANPDAQLSVMGIFSVSGLQFPWVLVAMHWLFGQGFILDLLGIVAGHSWVYLRDILPETHGWNLLPTPQLLRDWLPDQRVMGGVSGGGFMPASRQPAAPAATRTFTGRGRVLGD